MKIRIIFFVSVLLLAGCNEITEKEKRDAPINSLEKSEMNYLLIKDNLYEDDNKKLVHRTIDVSLIGNPVYRYNGYLRVDTVIDGKDTYITPDITDVIDKKTFHLVSIDSSGNSLTTEYYEDKNNKYFLVVVADGGVLHMSKKSN